MKIIIDPYRGGLDTGTNIDGKYEKNILLDLSKYMESSLKKLGIDSELVRNTDVSLTDDERNSIINEIKNENDLIIQNRLSDNKEFDIIYPLRNSDALSSLISTNLEKNDINVSKYYQRRLPSDTMLDYYSITRNTKPNETLIIEYADPNNYEKIVNIITETIKSYIQKENIYIVKKGDSLYQIANKYNTTANELKELNNLNSTLLKINQILLLPTKKIAPSVISQYDTYIVKKGDSLYQIAKKYNITVTELKNINNLTSNLLSINQVLKVPKMKEDYITYKVISGDSLYQIAKKNNTTVDEIKSINNLSNNLLSIGQILKIPR